MSVPDTTFQAAHPRSPGRDELILTNARVVRPDGVVHGHVVVREGTIAEAAEGPTKTAGALDLEGDLLAPGLVELHSDNLERHVHPRPAVTWPMPAAILAHDAQIAGAGITTILDAIRIGDDDAYSGTTEVAGQMAGALAEAARNNMLRAEHLLHIRAELPVPEVADAIAPFADESTLRLVSLMDHSPGQRQFRDRAAWKTYYGGKHGLSEAELETFAEAQRARSERYAEANRKALAELCRSRCVPLASHDDTTVDHVKAAAQLGVSISEFPTTSEAAEAAYKAGMATVAGAPNVVRGGSHSGNVAAETLVAEGVLDALSSDYVPFSLLHAVFVLAGPEDRGLADLFAKVTRNPARMVGLTDRGEIAAGQRADLIRVRAHPDAPVVRNVWRAGRRVA